MPTPNPLAPVKGAGTTLWLYTGTGNAFANPLSDIDWNRLAKIKELTPGEMTAESYDDTYLDDEDADWNATAQGQNLLAIPRSPSPGSRVKKGKKTWSHGLLMAQYAITKSNTRTVPSTFSAAGAAAWVKPFRQKRSLPVQRKSPIPASRNWQKKAVPRISP